MSWTGVRAHPVFQKNFHSLFLVDFFGLTLLFLKGYNKMLFMLIAEVWGSPVNFAPKVSTFLVSPYSRLWWGAHSLQPGCLGLNLHSATPRYVTTGTVLNFSVPSLLNYKTRIIIGPILIRLLWGLSRIIFVKHLEQGSAPVGAVITV